MKNLRSRFERFCYKNRHMGIPNLMLYIIAGTAIVYLVSQFTGNPGLYSILFFDRSLILRGQVWRLFTYPLTYGAFNGNILLIAISLYCYYSIGRTVEMSWGTLKFNLFYLTGVILMDIYCLLFGGSADVTYLNLSLLLAYATMYPDAQFLLFFFIPIKAWFLALVYIAIALFGFFSGSVFSVISLANYFLFFGRDVLNVLPLSWRVKAQRLFRGSSRKNTSGPKVVPFRAEPKKQTATQSRPQSQTNYRHRCTICGRTNVSDPDLEFRYCSRCTGYHCYCEDHISNHAHIQ